MIPSYFSIVFNSPKPPPENWNSTKRTGPQNFSIPLYSVIKKTSTINPFSSAVSGAVGAAAEVEKPRFPSP